MPTPLSSSDRLPKMKDCTFCGWPGFETEHEARTHYNVMQQRGKKGVVYLQCPLGAGRWHVNDTLVKPLDQFKDMLMNARPPAKTRDREHPNHGRATLGDAHPALAEVRPVVRDVAPLAVVAPPPTSRSNERHRCSSGKVGYGSQAIAEQMLDALKADGEIDVKRAYQCVECARWHLTSREADMRTEDIAYEEVTVFTTRSMPEVTVEKGMWPDGRVANLTLRDDRGNMVRLLPDHAQLLRRVIQHLFKDKAP